MAKSFILVGDHFQLPPLVQNKEAQEGGLDMSLFRLLSEQHPDAVVSLEHQYRMCADIMSLANALIYSGRLKCGNNAVATRSLILPKADEALHKHHSTSSLPSTHIPQYICVSPSSPSCHLSVLLDPSVRVLFLNTDTIGPLANELSNGNRTTNPLEAALATQIAHILLSAGLRASDLGIITFYRSQLALLRQHLRSIPSLELHTADKFQGRDKEAVLVSFVRSNADSNVGELLKDWRRINVAVTRARSKLIILGSAKTLSGGGDVLNGLVRMCKDNGWWFDLQPGVGDGHVWPGMGASQIDESQRSTILPRAAAAAAAAAGGDVIGCASPARQRTSGPRAPLDDIEGNVLLSPGRKGLKMPDNVGRVGLREVLGQKAVMRDILNDVL
jgi:DNA replication ATP-dependent helicase Dna2